MAKRKTIEVERIRERVNKMLAQPDSDVVNESGRIALCIVLEDVLHETGNYRGFGYVNGYNPELPEFREHQRRYF